MKTVGFIGGGRITQIILQAYENVGYNFNQINVFDINTQVLNKLKSAFKNINIVQSIEETVDVDLLIVALHPPVLVENMQKISTLIKQDTFVLSLAPKITLSKMHDLLPQVKNMARMNPTASSIINEGYNPIAYSNKTEIKAKENIQLILNKLGKLFEVEEEKLEAYAIINAMGHTYFWYQLQQIKELGIQFGLDDEEAGTTITEMLNGTAKTLFSSGLQFNEVSDLVPVKPMSAMEEQIKNAYKENLTAIYQKIKP